MKIPFCKSIVSGCVLVALLNAAAASAAVTFIGEGSIPGNAVDQSGLTGNLEDGVTPHNQAGGFGSAFAYTGVKNVYVATPDRGPADGTTSYIDRLYTLRVSLTKLAPNSYQVTPVIESTRLLRSSSRSYFTGSAAAFDATNSPSSLRFDPEGVRMSRCGNSAFVSDEYGPFLYEFSVDSGKRLRSISVPNKYLIDFPSATADVELSNNVSGRQSNRGMEGLAISPDGSKLYGIMQSPLLQDGGLDATNSRVGTNNRIVEINIDTGATREFLYQLDSKGNGISEILAANDHQFLVLERDGKAGTDAKIKKVFLIDIAAATDIRGVKQLPQTGTPAGVTPVTKQLFIDMLSPAFGLAGASFPEKLEGLAFGPNLDDGRLLLLVVNDNDFVTNQPSRFLAFAIDHQDLPAFQPQDMSQRYSRECRFESERD
jgi:hypothetical protein